MVAGRRGSTTGRKSRDEIEFEVVGDLRSIIQRINRHAAQIEKSCGLSQTQLAALTMISHNPGVSVTGISKATGVHASTASNMLDKLEAKGLIERRRGGEDQRTVSLYPTPAGERLLRRAPGVPQHCLSAALAKMSDSEVRAVARSLHGLRAALADD